MTHVALAELLSAPAAVVRVAITVAVRRRASGSG